MRKVMFSLLLAAAGAIGLASPAPAEASGRIYVGLGDVTFSYGRPYWRHNREPLYVVYERGYPRYYRIAPDYYYDGPGYGYGYGYGYAPPPVVIRYDDRRYRGRHGYGYRDYRHDRRDRHRGPDRHHWDNRRGGY